MAEENNGKAFFNRFHDLFHVEVTPLEFTFLSKLLYAWDRFGNHDVFFASDEDLSGIGGAIKSSATLTKLRKTLSQRGFFKYRRGFKFGTKGYKTRYELEHWGLDNVQTIS